LVTGMVSSYQTFGEFVTWHPHWHTILLEGGFESHDHFFFIPIGASPIPQELWRRRVIGFFLKQGLLDDSLAESMLGWQHSGFFVEAGTRVYGDAARQSLSQYIVRAPVGLKSSPGIRTRTPCHGKPPRLATGKARSGSLTVSTLSPRSPSTSLPRGSIRCAYTGRIRLGAGGGGRIGQP
jgi:Putative transposase